MLLKHTNEVALIVVSLIWGTTFVLGKYAISHLPVYFYLSTRFFLAASTLLLFGVSSIRKSNKKEILISLLTGGLLFASYACQTTALQYTTVSKNAFICGLYVVLVPFASWLVFKETVTKFAFLGAVLATMGMGFLSLTGQENYLLSYGDFLAFLSAVFAALQIILIGKFAKKINPVVLAFFQLLAVAVISGIASLMLESWPGQVPEGVWWTILFLALPATTGAFLVQCWAQRKANQTVTAIIFSLESVFGALFAYLILKEPFTTKMLLGCLLLFTAMVLSQKEEKTNS